MNEWMERDHDLLIQIRTLVGTMQEDLRSMRAAVDNLSTDVGQRLRRLEDIEIRYPIDRISEEVSEWIRFRTRLAAYGTAVTVLAALASWMIQGLVQLLHLK